MEVWYGTGGNLTGASLKGPDLPVILFRHSMVALNASTGMIIGGSDGHSHWSEKTFIFGARDVKSACPCHMPLGYYYW